MVLEWSSSASFPTWVISPYCWPLPSSELLFESTLYDLDWQTAMLDGGIWFLGGRYHDRRMRFYEVLVIPALSSGIIR